MKEITFLAKHYLLSAYLRDFIRVNWLKKFFVALFIMLLTGFNSWSQSITVDGDPGDWEILEASDPAVFTHIEDPFGTGVIDNQFTEGSKDYNIAADLVWADGQTKAKNDIANALAYLDGTTLYFAGDKTSNNGDAQIGFWFYLNNTAPRVLQTSPTRGGDFYPEHADGDILVLIDFTGGGKFGTVTSYVWVGVGEGDYGNNNSLDLLGTGTVAQNNLSEFPVPDGWSFTSETYDQNQFFEGSIDLATLDISDACFSRFLVEARSSQELTASLDDFAAGEFNVEPQASVNDITACENDGPFILTATADGGLGTLAYEWRKLPSNDIIGTASTFEVTESGQYSVIILGQGVFGGKCPSQPAIATVDLISSPVPVVDNEAACEGDTATFSTADLGTGFTYQWYLDDVAIVGATSNSYTTAALALADSGGIYKVVVTDTNNSTNCTGEDSGTLTVNANPAPSVSDQSECEGDTATFSTADLGTGFTYQWYLDDVAIVGATSNSYTTAALALADSGGIYKVVVTDTNNSTNCTGEDSGTLTVNANPAPSVSDQSECEDDTATFSTANLGTGFTYQWYLDDVAIVGATSNSYTTAALALADSGGIYKVVVTDTNNSTNCTGEDSGTLTVNANPAPSVSDQSECEDDTATFSTANLGTGFTYQWYLDDVAIVGATSNSYTTAALALADSGGIYKVVVTDTNNSTNCTGEDSGTLTVNANPAPSVSDQSECEDDTATFSTANLGTGFTYQWYLDDVAIVGATSNSYTTAALALADSGGIYKVVVTDTNNSTNCTGESTGELTVIPLPVAPNIQTQLADCIGGDGSAALTYDDPEITQFYYRYKDANDAEAVFGSWTLYTGVISLQPGSYTFEVKYTEDGCISDEFTVNINKPQDTIVTLTPDVTQPDCATFLGTIEISNAAALGNLNYTVYNQANPTVALTNYDYVKYPTGGFTGLGVGTYLITAVSDNGCEFGSVEVTLVEPQCVECETAFGKDDDGAAICFEDVPDADTLIPNETRWGWTNLYSFGGGVGEDVNTLNLYQGAAHCEDGTFVGTVTLTRTGNMLSVKFEASGDYYFSAIHLYVGGTPFMYKKQGKNYTYTVAPGQYNQNPSSLPSEYVTEYTISGIVLTGDYYVIAHVEACTSEYQNINEDNISSAIAGFYKPNKRFATMLPAIDDGSSAKTVSTTTSLAETSDPLFSIAPVPFRDVLNIGYLFDYTSDVTIQIFDLNGRLLATYNDTAVNSESISTFSVDFRTKAGQIYIVRMTTASEVYTAKIIADR